MLGTRSSIETLVHALRTVDFRDAAPEALGLILTTFPVDEHDLAAYVLFDPQRYTRNLVFRNDDFELLVLCWSLGSGSPIHDHGGMQCAMKVVHGSLNVDDYVILAGGRRPGYAQIAHSGATTMLCGSIDVRTPARDLHRVTAAREAAISLHVYAKPLNRFMIFDQAKHACRTVFGRYDSMPTQLL